MFLYGFTLKKWTYLTTCLKLQMQQSYCYNSNKINKGGTLQIRSAQISADQISTDLCWYVLHWSVLICSALICADLFCTDQICRTDEHRSVLIWSALICADQISTDQCRTDQHRSVLPSSDLHWSACADLICNVLCHSWCVCWGNMRMQGS